MIRGLKERHPHIHIKALTAVEIAHLARIEKISEEEVLLGAVCPSDPSCFARLPSGSALSVDGFTRTVFLAVHGEPAWIWEFDLMESVQ